MNHPKILMPGKIREINNYLLEKTGCFAFLMEDRLQWDYARPQTAKEAFEMWSIALYVVYHDYGCGYLPYLLSENNVMMKEISIEAKQARNHYNNVVKCFRNNFAHGILDKASRDRMLALIDKYYLKERRGNECFYKFTDDDWVQAAQLLKIQADQLYETLMLWADNYNNSPFRDFLSARKIFGESEDFKNSVCERIVFDTLDKDIDKGKFLSTKNVLADSMIQKTTHKNAKETLNEWQKIIQNEFLTKKINTDQDIIKRLKELLKAVYIPEEKSSVNVAAECGFGLEEVLQIYDTVTTR